MRGRIVKTHKGGTVTFLNFHEDYKKHLSLVVHAAAYDRFPSPPHEIYDGVEVEVIGRVTTFRGQIQITINSPDQIVW